MNRPSHVWLYRLFLIGNRPSDFWLIKNRPLDFCYGVCSGLETVFYIFYLGHVIN